MNWRKYTHDDYEVIEEWFLAHGWPEAPEPRYLPTTGIIVEDDDGESVGVGFLYISNSELGFLDWIATRPGLGRRGIKVMDFLIATIVDAAKGVKVTRVLHMSKPKYTRVFEKRYNFKHVETLAMLVGGIE